MAFSYFIKVHHAGGAPARSCEGRTGPSLHPPHPWPTLYSLDEFLFIQNKLNISLFFMDVKNPRRGSRGFFNYVLCGSARDSWSNYSTSLPWHFLYLRPEPHQQRSLRPSFAPACCWARFTAAARAALAAAERFGRVPGSALCGIG